MENKKNIEDAITAGLFVEISLRRKLHRLKPLRRKFNRLRRSYKRRKQRRNILRSIRRKRRPHRLPPGWRNIAVDGWDAISI
jgi:hypothetical protein